jgi:hypothetical protein
MSTRNAWIVAIAVVVPILLIGAAHSDKPLTFIVLMGLLFFFAAGAGINLGGLQVQAREKEARDRRRALDRDTALDVLRSERLDRDDRF